MKITRPDLAALAVCALVVVGIVLLSAMHTPIPDVLPTLALVALSAGAGVATQAVSASADTKEAVSSALQDFLAAETHTPAPAAVPVQPAAPAVQPAAPAVTAA